MTLPRSAALACCLALLPTAARAQIDTGERFDGDGHRVLVELGGAERREGPFDRIVFPRDFVPPEGGVRPLREPPSFSGATLAVYARARVLTDDDLRGADNDNGNGNDGAITLDLELAWRGDATQDGIGRAGNPLVSAALGWATRDLVLRVALGAGVPLTSAYDHDVYEGRAYAMLRASQGHADVWLATEESFPVVLRARVEGRAGWLFAGGDLAGALMPTIPRAERRLEFTPAVDEVGGSAQLGAWIGARPIEQLALGARGQVVVQHGALEHPDVGYGYPPVAYTGYAVHRGPWFLYDQLEAFVSLIAFVRAEIDDLTLEGRLYVNLDTPDGPAFDRGATWSATLLAGWTP